MRSKKELELALKDEKEDLKSCNWAKPCASCFKAETTIHVLLWALGRKKYLIGNKPNFYEKKK